MLFSAISWADIRLPQGGGGGLGGGSGFFFFLGGGGHRTQTAEHTERYRVYAVSDGTNYIWGCQDFRK